MYVYIYIYIYLDQACLIIREGTTHMTHNHIYSWFGDDKVVEAQRRVLVKVVPYWYQFDYDPRNHRSAPLCGPVYHPPVIRAFYAAQGVHLPSSFS